MTDFMPSETNFRAESVIHGPGDCKIVYSMSAVKAQTTPTFTVNVTVANPEGGFVSPRSRTGIHYGSTTTFTVTPNSGYTVSVSEGSISGTTWTTDPVTSSHIATVTFIAAGGGLGSISNPIPMNWDSGWGNFYYPSNGTGPSHSTVRITATKLYFAVDSSYCGVQPLKSWYLTIKGYNNVNLRFAKIPQDKATGTLGTEVPMVCSQGDAWDTQTNAVTIDFETTRMLYSVVAVEDVQDIDINVKFMQ